ncbi:MAG TPA: SDR family NAD(P)-dependent oxidoreductase [Acidimicrobiales bacterium]|nr:SDR family NAD(P)-dependent oxidoreductase [Acidimicrobiales bacterium]
MKNINGKVAVITGGASGLGKAFAKRLGEAGMKLALADVEVPVLEETVADLRSNGIEVIGVPCDVSSAQSMKNFSETVLAEFGEVHVLCLNAGVASGGPIVESSLEEWRWVLGVNLYGIIHGLDAFLPGLVEQNEGHIVMTASIAGHTSFANLASYNASKHATVTIAETLFAEMKEAKSDVGVSCLCPGFVSTNIFTSDRNQPEELQTSLAEPPSEEEVNQREAALEWLRANALQPEFVADLVYDAIIEKHFWIFTEESHTQAIAARHKEIQERRDPTAERITEEF